MENKIAGKDFAAFNFKCKFSILLFFLSLFLVLAWHIQVLSTFLLPQFTVCVFFLS